MARFMRTDLGPGHSRLKPPAVVGQGVVFPPTQGYLHPLLGARQEQRKRYRSFLRRPTVTTAPQPFVAAPITVTLAPTVLPGHRTMAGIRPPRFVGAGITFRKVKVSLAYSRRGAPKSRLRPPTVVFPPPLPRPPQVHLAYQSRGKPRSRLPRIVYPAIQYRPVQTHLAYSRRGPAKSRLPAVVVPPVSVLARPTQIHLAYSIRGRTMAGVRPPRFVGAGITFRAVQIHLAQPFRGKPKSRLYAPVAVTTGAVVYSGPKVTVARRPVRPVTASVLGRPIVVLAVAAFGGVGIQLVRTPRTRTLHRLNPPTVIAAPAAAVYFGPQTALAYSLRGAAKSVVGKPTVVDRRVYPGPQISLAPQPQQGRFSRCFTGATSERRLVRTNLVANGGFENNTAGWTAVGSVLNVDQPGLFGSNFLEIQTDDLAAVEGAYTTFYANEGPYTVSAYVSDSHGASGTVRLVVRDSAGGNPQFGPLFSPGVAWARYSLTVTLTSGTWRLSIETDVQQALTLEVEGVQAERGAAAWPYIDTNGSPASSSRSDIFGYERCVGPQLPRVLEQSFAGAATTLAPKPSRPTKSVLRSPTVIRTDRFFGPSVTLAYSRRGLPRSVLGKPTVIDLRPQVYYLTVALAPSRRGVPKSRLLPPTVVDRRVYGGPTVTLAPSVRGVPRSVLRKPAVIDTRTYYGPAATLAYSLRGKPRPRLSPPTVIGLPPFRPLAITLVAVRTRAEQSAHRTMAGVRPPRFVGPGVFFRPILVRLARIVPQPTITRLSPPAVTQAPPKAELELRVTLAYSVRGKPKSVLRKPAVIDTRPQTRFLSVNLAYSRRGLATYGLAAPAEIGAPINFRPVQVTLAYSVRGKPKSALRRPTVIDLTPQTRFLTVSLAYSRRGRPVYELKPPAVIDRTVYFGPTSTLTYSRRGRPKSVLRKPVVIDLRPQTRFVSVNLTYSRRGRPASELRPPTVIDRRVYFGPETKLAYSRRGRPVYELKPPTVVDLRPQAKYLSVSLAYSRRGRPLSALRRPVLRAPEIFRPVETILVRLDLRRRRPVYRLRAPSVVGQIVFHGPTVTLAPHKRGLAKPFLTPPAAIRPPFVSAPLVVHLAYSLRGKPRSFLRKPVLAAETFAGPFVHLAPSRFPQPMHRLAPPAVIGGGIAFYGPQTTLVTIVHPPVQSLLKPPTVVSTYIPPAGDVCGTDEPAADDCGTDQAVTDDVCGTDEPAFDVSGSDSPESRIVGSDTAIGDVCGTDEQST